MSVRALALVPSILFILPTLSGCEGEATGEFSLDGVCESGESGADCLDEESAVDEPEVGKGDDDDDDYAQGDDDDDKGDDDDDDYAQGDDDDDDDDYGQGDDDDDDKGDDDDDDKGDDDDDDDKGDDDDDDDDVCSDDSYLDCDVGIDFERDDCNEHIYAGQRLEYAYSDLGVELNAWSDCDREYPAALIAFDTSMPTGDDYDLGTPNYIYGGPGFGYGYGSQTNDEHLGNVAIIAENIHDDDWDGYVDEPDDNAYGGLIEILFDEPVCFCGVDLLDIDYDEWASVTLYGEYERYLDTEWAIPLGDNSWQHVETRECGVRRAEIKFSGSAALADFCFGDNVDDPTCTD